MSTKQRPYDEKAARSMQVRIFPTCGTAKPDCRPSLYLAYKSPYGSRILITMIRKPRFFTCHLALSKRDSCAISLLSRRRRDCRPFQTRRTQAICWLRHPIDRLLYIQSATHNFHINLFDGTLSHNHYEARTLGAFWQPFAK